MPDGPDLEFPESIAADPSGFDGVLAEMMDLSQRDAEPSAFANWLQRNRPDDGAGRDLMVGTYANLRALQRDGRNHIWGYVARNLVRPLWLSTEGQKADVVIGNPPWLSYRYMAEHIRKRFRDECTARSLWAGGKLATHQDLSSYFFVRSVELYLKPEGLIAFVMPYAALNRAQFRGFRRGAWHFLDMRFDEVWAFDENVQPLFPVPSSVFFGRRGPPERSTKTVLAAEGTLARRDATAEEAERALAWRKAPWPPESSLEGGSPYRKAFRQGATMVPRRLCVVERVELGRFGGNPEVPVVRGRTSNLDKPPWREVEPVELPVEARFLRPLYLGECIAPFRVLEPALAVIPWDEQTERLLDAESALALGYARLAKWMEWAEATWKNPPTAKTSTSNLSLIGRWDYQHGLANQFPVAPIRVLFAASGSNPAAAKLNDDVPIVEHGLYWTAASTDAEARYLIAIFNSEVVRRRIEARQSRGQWGARHFDKVMFDLPIPRFEATNELHMNLAATAEEAEKIAASVPIKEAMHFTRIRRDIRDALKAAGVAGHIDSLVESLLGPA